MAPLTSIFTPNQIADFSLFFSERYSRGLWDFPIIRKGSHLNFNSLLAFCNLQKMIITYLFVFYIK